MTEREAFELYDEYLDEIGIENLITSPASAVLKDFDPTMYDCGFADWLDGQDFELEGD